MGLSRSSWSMTSAYVAAIFGKRNPLTVPEGAPISWGVDTHRNTGTRCPKPAGSAPCPKRLASHLSLSLEDSPKGAPPSLDTLTGGTVI